MHQLYVEPSHPHIPSSFDDCFNYWQLTCTGKSFLYNQVRDTLFSYCFNLWKFCRRMLNYFSFSILGSENCFSLIERRSRETYNRRCATNVSWTFSSQLSKKIRISSCMRLIFGGYILWSSWYGSSRKWTNNWRFVFVYFTFTQSVECRHLSEKCFSIYSIMDSLVAKNLVSSFCSQ